MEKHETTIELEKMCERIANEIHTGTYDFNSEESDYDEPCASDYLQNMLDCRYIINSNKEYMGANILIAFGGPNIRINTIDKCVEGYWGRDEVKRYYREDKLGLFDHMEQIYQC